MSLLALDLAQQVGWARRSPGVPIRWGSRRFKFPTLGEQLYHYRRWLIDRLLEDPPVTACVYELPFIGRKSSQATVTALLSLGGTTDEVCFEFAVPVWSANNASVRLHYIGVGRGKRDRLKALTMARARAQGYAVENDDEADAIAVMDYAVSALGLGLAPGPLFDGGPT